MMSTVAENQDLNRAVAALEHKRQILERVVDITRAIETMQESLNAVLVMGAASTQLPAEVLKCYGSLSDSLCNLPINRLREYHANLELIVRKQLNRILNYAGIDFSAEDQVEFITLCRDDDKQSPVEMLNAFKRTAQTAVSLRALLRKRGVSTPDCALPASAELIKQQLNHLSRQEQVQRSRIRSQIEAIQAEITRMIDNPAYPQEMKAVLREAVGNLDRDLRLLAHGVSIQRLSFVAEPEEIPVSEAAGELPQGEGGMSEDDPPLAHPAAKDGLSETAIQWLKSPWDERWDELKKRH